VALVGGAWLVDPAALGKLPWRGLVPPDSKPAGYAAAQPTPQASEVTRPSTLDTRADRSARPAADASGAPSAAPVLSLPGSFPASGPGSFDFAASPSATFGTAGTLRRFQVGVEKGVPEDLATFAEMVDRTLGDPRGWTAGGQVRLQRVPLGVAADFTIYLATPETARKMCAQGKVDIVEKGQPYTSCRAPRKVILNLARWRQSVPDYVTSRAPLDSYRQYMINHEVGHELGHGHELCPGKGKPAPVMQQQTLGLYGCVGNAWPYLDGKRYAGPPGAYDGSAG
jgi:hypothetical protein